ncbi:MAG: hypothetical protein QXZ44_04525 [Ferroplasma sp.]
MIYFKEYMVKSQRKAISITIIIILIVSSLMILDDSGNTSNKVVSSAVPLSCYNNNSSNEVIAYIPAELHTYIVTSLEDNNIPYSFIGDLLNVNYSQNPAFLKSFFNTLKNTLNIDYFIFNSSDDFIPYESSGGSAQPYYPSNIYDAYDINYIHDEGYCGNGTTIVIVDAYGDPNIRYDVSAFDNITGLPPINLNISTPMGAITSTNSGWATETALDVEWSHAIAPGAKIDLVLSPSSSSRLLDSVEYAVNHTIGNIISISWGSPESGMQPSEISLLNSIYENAAEKNITVLAASGDEGADDGTSSPTVNFPAADPWVLGVGGTTLTENAAGVYTQTAWGTSPKDASGGGYSVNSTPYYQVAPNYSSTRRGVPDVALDANPNTGVFAIVDGEKYKLGGTSIATPMWAGIVAIMDQYFNTSLGFINPLLYKISETKYYTNAFTQITKGSNFGYNAGPGWNPVTGLGTPLVSNLINDSRIIMESYGSILLLNNTSSANKISSEIVVPSNAVEEYNGSTFYYTGFYYNQSNYVKFGIDANSTGYYYIYTIMDNGTETSEVIDGKNNAYVTVEIAKSEVFFKINNNTINNIIIPLAFSGDYHADIGVQQDNPEINFINIPKASFSSIKAYYNTTLIPYTGAYEEGYSGLGSSYSNITFSKSGNAFTAIMGKANNTQLYGEIGGPSIIYSITYGTKSTLTFSINHGSTTKFYENGKPIGNTTKLSGGYYTINATASGTNISRIIYVPEIKQTNININYTPSYCSPEYSLAIDHYFNYRSSSPSIGIYELNNTINNATISSRYYYTGYASETSLSSIELIPINVKLTVFSPNGNATVTFNSKTVSNDDGNHYASLTPESVYINVTKDGYANQSETVHLYPGSNKYVSILLKPNNSNLTEITGKVENIVYKYGLSNVNITSDNEVLGYTNTSGNFFLFLSNKTDVSFSEELYNDNNTTILKNQTSGLLIYMYPANVTVLNIDFKITYAIPLGFYYVYVSWTPYLYSNFGEYVVYYSTNLLMINAKTAVITDQSTAYTLLPGLTPGKTYYIIVDMYSPDGSFISSNEEVVHYNIFSYLLNALIYLLIGIYIAFMVRFFIRRGRRKKLEEEKFDDDFFNQNE